MENIFFTYIVPIGTLILQVILFFTAKNLLPSYFNEKGKNLAQKEDIESLTKLVETVKFNFTQETEFLKSKLQLLSNIQGNLIIEERNAIVDFNEKYFNWYNFLIDFTQANTEKS